ncbi:MAG: stage sporulation protein, partial [Cohnella sp.]|nr:stage sporulation protein [Cohnella sp.]
MKRKVTNFMALPAQKKRLMLEALVYLGWARILKALPFSRIAPSLGKRMMETPLEHEPSNERLIGQISQAVRVMSRHT